MSARAPQPPPTLENFFVGWSSRVPQDLAPPLRHAAFVFFGIALAAGLCVGLTLRDGGDGTFVEGGGQMVLAGRLVANPVPILQILDADGRHDILLAGDGKRGVVSRARALDGHGVAITGVMVKRGDVPMLVTTDRDVRDDAAPEGAVSLSANADGGAQRGTYLGFATVTGEICDGKCVLGAMHPGTGLAHKACANLCLQGGVPPVFVSAIPVFSRQFFVLAPASGTKFPADFYDAVARPVTLTGDVYARGGLVYFYADFSAITFL